MEKTNKDVMQESARVIAETTDIPDGPNVAPSPLEHLAAQGVVKPPLHTGELQPGTAAQGSTSPDDVGEAAAPDDAVPND